MIKPATFGMGCFWKPDILFMKTPSVIETEVGFMGGEKENPTYKQVCYENTGHAEVVHIKYDPDKVSYEELLKIFWENHDPTQVDRQGPDIGEQYRTVVFYYDGKQKELAEKSKKELELSGKYKQPIATHIVPAAKFYKAEEYHQKYLIKNTGAVC